MTIAEALAKAWPAGTASQPLRSIQDAVTVGIDCRYHWFRGHSKTVDLILPGIYREPFSSSGRSSIEFMAAQRFR